jgi:hypothetical protein
MNKYKRFTMAKNITQAAYRSFLADMRERIDTARSRAVRSVNHELMAWWSAFRKTSASTIRERSDSPHATSGTCAGSMKAGAIRQFCDRLSQNWEHAVMPS